MVALLLLCDGNVHFVVSVQKQSVQNALSKLGCGLQLPSTPARRPRKMTGWSTRCNYSSTSYPQSCWCIIQVTHIYIQSKLYPKNVLNNSIISKLIKQQRHVYFIKEKLLMWFSPINETTELVSGMPAPQLGDESLPVRGSELVQGWSGPCWYKRISHTSPGNAYHRMKTTEARPGELGRSGVWRPDSGNSQADSYCEWAGATACIRH
jgi:hypothetical protein